jgi:YidC/Oxa1 family membrane protein insertase
MNLVKSKAPHLPLLVTFHDSGFTLPEDAAWQALPHGEGELAYAWESPEVRVEKRYSFPKDGYEVKLAVTVENKTEKPLSPNLQLVMYGWHDPTVKPGGMFSRRNVLTEGACDLGGRLKKGGLEALGKQPIAADGEIRWVGIAEQYFLQAAAPAPEAKPADANTAAPARKCEVTAQLDGTLRSALQMPTRILKPKEKTTYSVGGFFGPKTLAALDAVTVDGMDVGLGSALDYGWTEVIARPMLAVLRAIHHVMPNWGVCIIVLTILIKLVTWYPTQKSMQSMRAMAKLKPEMEKLQKLYANDKQRLNMEVMGLYKKHGVNPVGGCLPMLIQMPIYIALYSMLGNSVELYRSAFALQIQDLTAPDPYYVLPLLTGALMFAQQKLSPTPPDDSQKAMMYMMPVMFTAFSIFLPAGLTIYILTNTGLTMAQQWWMNRSEPKKA